MFLHVLHGFISLYTFCTFYTATNTPLLYTIYTFYTATNTPLLYTIYTFYTAIKTSPLYMLYTFYTVFFPSPLHDLHVLHGFHLHLNLHLISPHTSSAVKISTSSKLPIFDSTDGKKSTY